MESAQNGFDEATFVIFDDGLGEPLIQEPFAKILKHALTTERFLVLTAVKTIPLTQGKEALVDDTDFLCLNQHKWFAQRNVYKNQIVWYAARMVGRKDGSQGKLYMHREIAAIIGTPEVDHQDSNGLNNQRDNLRPATHQQNLSGQHKQPNCSSQYKGVYWHRGQSKWAAHIGIKGVRAHLGTYSHEKDAAKAYNEAALQAFGIFARLNCL